MTSIIEEPIECTHQTIGADPSAVTFHPCHHVYKRGDKELDSVSKVLRACWPVKPDYSKISPDVVENARLRGVDVDEMFSAWVSGKATRFPAGTRREDSRKLFLKLVTWWRLRYDAIAESQVILANGDVAGTCDIITPDRHILDLKTTYKADEPMYELQLGMYALLYLTQFGELPRGLGIIHLTERFEKPQFIPVDLKQALYDATAVLEVWKASKRRMRLKEKN